MKYGIKMRALATKEPAFDTLQEREAEKSGSKAQRSGSRKDTGKNENKEVKRYENEKTDSRGGSCRRDGGSFSRGLRRKCIITDRRIEYSISEYSLIGGIPVRYRYDGGREASSGLGGASGEGKVPGERPVF